MLKAELINIYQAKTHLSKLCGQAAAGRDVILARHGHPWVRLTALEPLPKPVTFGVMKGEITVADDFDAPLAPEIQREFEGF